MIEVTIDYRIAFDTEIGPKYHKWQTTSIEAVAQQLKYFEFLTIKGDKILRIYSTKGKSIETQVGNITELEQIAG